MLYLGILVKKSALLRGLSSFDPSVLSHSSQDVYEPSFTQLVNYFMASGHLDSSDRDVALSEYRSFVSKLQREEVQIPLDSIPFLSSLLGHASPTHFVQSVSASLSLLPVPSLSL